MVSKIQIIILLFLLVINVSCITTKAEKNDSNSCLKKYPNDLKIKLNPMIELDFKSKAEVYEIRKKYVFQHPELITRDYKPSEDVFGQIIDGKPWWGMKGICYYSSGMKSIEGPSEETRFLANPFLLIGLAEVYAFRLINETEPAGETYEPEALNLEWKGKKNLFLAKYKVSNYFNKLSTLNIKNPLEWKLNLIAYNARDLGFNYLYVMPQYSKNVSSMNKTARPVEINQYIHCGNSCGYPGGGNNMSPTNENLMIELIGIPARAYIHLWKNRPENIIKDKPDMVFIIDMI
jgi:hypothetical protein